MNSLKPMRFIGAVLLTAVAGLVLASAQDAPDVGPKAAVVVSAKESHIGNLTGHSADAKSDYRRYCAGCHGNYGDGEGENAPWLDPKPRNFTLGQFKCRSTPTGTLPTDEDLYDTIGRGVVDSNMPQWLPLTDQARVDMV